MCVCADVCVCVQDYSLSRSSASSFEWRVAYHPIAAPAVQVTLFFPLVLRYMCPHIDGTTPSRRLPFWSRIFFLCLYMCLRIDGTTPSRRLPFWSRIQQQSLNILTKLIRCTDTS